MHGDDIIILLLWPQWPLHTAPRSWQNTVVCKEQGFVVVYVERNNNPAARFCRGTDDNSELPTVHIHHAIPNCLMESTGGKLLLLLYFPVQPFKWVFARVCTGEEKISRYLEFTGVLRVCMSVYHGYALEVYIRGGIACPWPVLIKLPCRVGGCRLQTSHNFNFIFVESTK